MQANSVRRRRPARCEARALVAASLLFGAGVSQPALAGAPAGISNASPPVGLEDVLVNGPQAGPGLWRVSDGEHNLWILGTLDLLPKSLVWHAPQVEAILRRSQALIAPPEARMSVGTFTGLLLLPTWLRARQNPGGQTLRDVLPADIYLRWSYLKDRYFGGNQGVERLRPILAVHELYEKALSRSELSNSKRVWDQVRDSARAYKVPVVAVEVTTRVDDPKAALRDWQALPPGAEVGCFSDTLDRLERDIALMRRRATLWSVGDVNALREVVDLDPAAACVALLRSVASASVPVENLRARLDAAWLQAAAKALSTNQSTVAVLPIRMLLRPDGVLDRLRERGLAIDAP